MTSGRNELEEMEQPADWARRISAGVSKLGPIQKPATPTGSGTPAASTAATTRALRSAS